MTRRAPIRYRDFWDVPRIFFVEDRGRLFLFDCQFDERVEDYPDVYQVFLMPPLTEADYAGSWAPLYQRATAKLGDVPVSAVVFDPTKRQAINAVVLDPFFPTAPLSTANGVAHAAVT